MMERKREGGWSRREFLKRSAQAGAIIVAGPALLGSQCNGRPPATVPPLPPNSFGIVFGRANPFGIALDDAATVWNAGHVTDVIEHASGVVVANQSGGVWLCLDTGTVGIELSMEWEDPDVNCLARGPDGDAHFYAGCASQFTAGNGALYVTDVATDTPLIAPWTKLSIPGVGIVRRIAIVADQRRIVLATSNGIWWSTIPMAGSSAYSFRRATGLPVATGDFFSVITGPNDTVVASAWPQTSTDIPNNHFGIFVGSWQGTDLQFAAATITGTDARMMRATSLGACAAAPGTMYAVAAGGDQFIFAMLASPDGGATWSDMPATLMDPSGSSLHDIASDMGNGWNNALGVSATNPREFWIGWRNGPFRSIDGGMTFTGVPVTPAGHQDFHAIRFTPQRVYLGSDGGVHYSNDNGATFDTRINKRLANLQFLGPSTRQFYGVFGASTTINGLVAGGLQDNDCVYSLLDDSGAVAPWRQFYAGADGGPTAFVAAGQVLSADIARNVQRASWDVPSNRFTGLADVPVGVASPTGPAAGMPLPDSVIEPVKTPTFAVSGRLMYALKGVNRDVYGLFANADGSNMTWDHVTTLPLAAGDVISAVTSVTGAKVVAGTRGTASIFHFDMANPSLVTPATGLPGDQDSNNFILQIVVVSEAPFDAYAIRFIPRTSTLFRANGGTSWSPVNGRGQPPGNIGYFCLAADTSHSPPLVILGAEDYVYASSTSGATWENVSNGLPRVSHCSDLRVVTQPNGHRYLYLATFGRSVWRATLT